MRPQETAQLLRIFIGEDDRHDGHPLYGYKEETGIGATRGDGLQTGWHAAVVEPLPQHPAWVKVHESDVGPILTNAQGMTLYTRRTKVSGASRR